MGWNDHHPGLSPSTENIRIADMMTRFWGILPPQYLAGLKRTQRYRLYLGSPRWQEIRAAILERSGGICESCYARPVEHVHHERYPDDLGFEEENDLVGVCAPCHRELHRPGNRYDGFPDSQSR